MALMKQGIRVIGIDDSPFERGHQDALVVGVVCRRNVVEGVLSTRVSVDGDDGTERLCAMLRGSRFRQQLRAILMNGIMVAGFNAVDINMLSSEIGVPVIALTRKNPDSEAVKRALMNVRGWQGKARIIDSAGTPKKIGPWHIQAAGIDLNGTRDIIRIFGNGPTRLAHIIASGIVTGESHGRS